MRKNNYIFNAFLVLCTIFSQNMGLPSFAQERVQALQSSKDSLQVFTPVVPQENTKEENTVYTYSVEKDQVNSANELNMFLAEYLIDLNSHNIKKIEDYYASNFISDDGFNKNQVIDLIKQSWKKYPDLKYSTVIKNLRLDNNRSSIEIIEDITATTNDKSDITKDKGCVNGKYHNILYLEKYGCGWKIITDKTLYEETAIKYGTAKNININFNVPEQVLSGEDYTASLKIDLPSDVFALASLTSVPFVYPVKQPVETFRQVPVELNSLERVIKSNKEGLNEISSASVSFCEAERTNYTGINLKVTGIAVVLKKVNVLLKR